MEDEEDENEDFGGYYWFPLLFSSDVLILVRSFWNRESKPHTSEPITESLIQLQTAVRLPLSPTSR